MKLLRDALTIDDCLKQECKGCSQRELLKSGEVPQTEGPGLKSGGGT